MTSYTLEESIQEFIKELFAETTIVTNSTLDNLFSEKKHGANALTLYMFYIRMGKKQSTNQPYATDKFCRKGLRWGKDKLKSAKALLQKYNLIESIQRRDEKGRIVGNYIRVRHMWSENDALRKVLTHEHQNPLVEKPSSGKRETNASSKSIEMLQVNQEEMLAKHKSISYLENIPKEDLRDFVTKYACYPKDVIDKANSLIDYCKSKGKKYKDYKAFLNNALRKDYGLRPITNPGEGDFIW